MQDPAIDVRICTGCKVPKPHAEFYETSTQCKKCMKDGAAARRDARQGIIYLASNEAWEDFYKIGTCKDVDVMMKTLQTCSPLHDYVVEYQGEFDDVTSSLSSAKAEYDFDKGWVNGELQDIIYYLDNLEDNI